MRPPQLPRAQVQTQKVVVLWLQAPPPPSSAGCLLPCEPSHRFPREEHCIPRLWHKNFSWGGNALISKRTARERDPGEWTPRGQEPGRRTAHVLCLRNQQTGPAGLRETSGRRRKMRCRQADVAGGNPPAAGGPSLLNVNFPEEQRAHRKGTPRCTAWWVFTREPAPASENRAFGGDPGSSALLHQVVSDAGSVTTSPRGSWEKTTAS